MTPLNTITGDGLIVSPAGTAGIPAVGSFRMVVADSFKIAATGSHGARQVTLLFPQINESTETEYTVSEN